MANSAAGFKMFPFAQHKVQGYASIFFAYAFFNIMGGAYVQKLFGDSKQYNYLYWNKSAIMKGTMPWEKAEQ